MVLIASGVTVTAFGLIRHDQAYSRPYGIPAAVPDSQINLMELSPVPVRPAPGFTLTDQNGQILSLSSSFRGKVVVLEFMDPHCTDTCPIVSDEFVDAYHDLGRLAGSVVFAAVNVNQYHNAVADVSAFSREHRFEFHPQLALPHRLRIRAPGRMAGLQRRRAGTGPRRRYRPLLRRLLHRPARPGTVSRLASGGPHQLRGVIPTAGTDRRLGTGNRAGRPPPRRLTTEAGARRTTRSAAESS